jgi:hypothetical protein
VAHLCRRRVGGAEWIPLAYRKEIEAGSALDFSCMGFTDAPLTNGRNKGIVRDDL